MNHETRENAFAATLGTIARVVMGSTFLFVAASGPSLAHDRHHWKRSGVVKCDEGRSLQKAFDRARPGATIRIRGICEENVLLRIDRVAVECEDGGGVLGIAGTTAFRVTGSNVTVTECAIAAGDARAAAFSVLGSGSAAITDSTLAGGRATGASVSQGAYMRVVGNTIAGRTGVLASGNSMMDVADNDITVTGTGIFVGNGSSADIVDNTITDTTLNAGGFSTGVSVQRQATANFSNDISLGAAPNVIQGFNIGIRCRDNSSIRIGSFSTGVLQDPGTGNVKNAEFEGAPAGCSVEIRPSDADGFLPLAP